MKKIESVFENFLWNSRFLVLIPVISSLLGSFILFIVGTLDIIKVTLTSINYYLGRETQDIHDFIVTDIILAIDIYLVAVVLLIFGTGIYRLFISPIDESEVSDIKHPFNIQSFDELKDLRKSENLAEQASLDQRTIRHGRCMIAISKMADIWRGQ